MMLSELIVCISDGTVASTIDHRGAIWNDDYNCTMFMAYTAPNSTVPDWVTTWCLYPYQTNPPCTNTSPAFNAARSYHPGGVNALFCDGYSVKFEKSSVSVVTWRGVSQPLRGARSSRPTLIKGSRASVPGSRQH